MTDDNWVCFRNAQNCYICDKNLIVPEFLDSIGVWDKNTGKCCGKSHKKCYWSSGPFIGPINKRQAKDPTNKWIEKTQTDCLFCGNSLLRKKFRDAVKDHCHVSRNFRGAAHDACNKKLRTNPKTIPILVVFHNLKGYDAHHLMQAMSQTENAGQLNCIANNKEK